MSFCCLFAVQIEINILQKEWIKSFKFLLFKIKNKLFGISLILYGTLTAEHCFVV